MTESINDCKQIIFGTPVWGAYINNEKTHIKDYIEAVENSILKHGSVKKSNSGGLQTHDRLHEEPVFKELCNKILFLTGTILDNYNIKNPFIISMWGNINDKYNYNWHHVHEGVLSGVLYLQVPKENGGRLILADPAVRSHNSRIKNPDFGIVPEPLAFFVFPSWLEHFVEPNMSDEIRISLSFNIGEKI